MELNENAKNESLETVNSFLEIEEKVRDALVSAGMVFTSVGAGFLVTTFKIPVLGPIAGSVLSAASFAIAAGSFVAAIKSQIKYKRLKNVKKWLEENNYSAIMKITASQKTKQLLQLETKF